jgi:pimeloyl-ACP methyl ester carboxylesterase
MTGKTRAFIEAGALLTTILFVVCAPAMAAKVTQDPSQGDGGVSPFYMWTDDIPELPGKMLREEALPGVLMLANASEGRRILYTSTDGIDGKSPVTVSGAVFFPKGSPPSRGWPIIAWAHGTVGIADVCAPSWRGRSQRDVDYLNAWLAQGYAVVASDYQGLGTPGVHPYLAVRPEAYSVLDSLRAALHEYPQLSNSVVIVGQSQGAQAAIAVAGLASQYVPEIAARGTVATGVPFIRPPEPRSENAPRPADGQSDKVDRTLTYRLLVLFLAQRVHPEFTFADYVSDRAMPTVALARTECYPAILKSALAAELTPGNAFRKDTSAVRAAVLPYMMYATLKFDHPVFVGTGTDDHDVDPKTAQYPLVKAACEAGSTIEYHYYLGLDHGGTVNASLIDSIPFVKKLFAGEPIISNCGSLQPPPAARN